MAHPLLWQLEVVAVEVVATTATVAAIKAHQAMPAQPMGAMVPVWAALMGVVAEAAEAWSVQHAQKRFSGFGEAMRKAPYVSCVLLTLLAGYMIYSGVHGLGHAPH